MCRFIIRINKQNDKNEHVKTQNARIHSLLYVLPCSRKDLRRGNAYIRQHTELKDRRCKKWTWVLISSRLQGCPHHSGPLFPHLQNRGQNWRISGPPLPQHFFDFAIHLISQKAFLSPAVPSASQMHASMHASLSQTTSFALQLLCARPMAPQSGHLHKCPRCHCPLAHVGLLSQRTLSKPAPQCWRS